MPDPALASVPGYGHYLAIPAFAALAVATVGGALLAVRVVTRLINRIPVPPGKASTYECGELPSGPAWFRFNSRFTALALVFLVFDVELVLLWPVLPRFLAWIQAGHGAEVLLKTGLFAGTLLLALVYAAVKGDLRWEAPRPGDRR